MIGTVTWLPAALETFDATVQSIENKWGEMEAGKFVKRTQKVIELIQTQPFMYQALDSLPVRRAVINKKCSLFYQVEGESIWLLWFWDNKRDSR